MSKKYLFVLGASDPEMAEIQNLLATAGQRFVYAMVGMGDSSRVHPGNAYKFAGTSGEFRDEDTVVLVECNPEPGRAVMLEAFREVIRVDHHRPGDYGYGRAPAEFFEASSLGQIRALLIRITGVGFHEAEENERHVLITAADHCLESAYRGKCPGVDPDALMRWRVKTRAEFQKRSAEDVLADVEVARQRLREARVSPDRIVVDLLSEFDRRSFEFIAEGLGDEFHGGYAVVADLRGQDVPELPEAAAREGIPFVASVTDRDGREKVVLQAAGPEVVRQFLAGNVVPGLKSLYGDPARGFAGGYVS